MRTRRWSPPPPTPAQRVAAGTGALTGLLAALLWLHLGRPAWSITGWGPGAGLGLAVLVAFTAPPGARLPRFGAGCGFVFAANGAAVTTAAIAAQSRGEDHPGRVVLGVVCLLLSLLPLLRPRQSQRQTGTDDLRPAGPPLRLTGNDSLFLSLDIPTQPMTVMALLTLRPGTGPDGSAGPVDLDALRRHVADRLPALPAFGWRVARVPFGLDHPVYVQDEAFDITRHVVEHVLPAPGTDEQLDAFHAEQACRPLDPALPLWRLVLVNGLADGRQVVLLVIHHAVLDGFALLSTLAILLGDVPTATPSAGPVPRLPGVGRTAAAVAGRWARTVRRTPALIRASKAHAATTRAAAAAATIVPPTAADAPVCVLNQASTGRRTFARTSFASADLEKVKAVAGVTVNDVVLALVAGAVRDHLSVRGALPAKPLVAWVPVGLDRAGAPPRTYGNRLAGLTTTLATDLVDPWQRLLRIGAVTAAAKRLLVQTGGDPMGDWLDNLPPVVVEAALHHHRRRLRRDPATPSPNANVVVSHVRGVSPGGIAGARLEAVHISGPPNSGCGLNITVAAHGDRLFVAVLCIDTAVGAPDELADGLHEALSELLALAELRSAAPARHDPAGATAALALPARSVGA